MYERQVREIKADERGRRKENGRNVWRRKREEYHVDALACICFIVAFAALGFFLVFARPAKDNRVAAVCSCTLKLKFTVGFGKLRQELFGSRKD